MFASEARKLGNVPFYLPTMITEQECLSYRDKHSSLLMENVNYTEKSFMRLDATMARC